MFSSIPIKFKLNERCLKLTELKLTFVKIIQEGLKHVMRSTLRNVVGEDGIVKIINLDLKKSVRPISFGALNGDSSGQMIDWL